MAMALLYITNQHLSKGVVWCS